MNLTLFKSRSGRKEKYDLRNEQLYFIHNLKMIFVMSNHTLLFIRNGNYIYSRTVSEETIISVSR